MKTRKIRILISICAIILVTATAFAACDKTGSGANAHNLSKDYAPNNNDSQTHLSSDENTNHEEHQWSDWTTSDDESASVSSRFCTICGKTETVVKGETHEHNPSSVHEKDDYYHWQTCSSCNEKINLEPHKWELARTSDADPSKSLYICKVCGHYKVVQSDNTSSCWGYSLYDDRLVAKHTYDENGKLIVKNHYLFICGVDHVYGALNEQLREIYVYDESGRLEWIEVYREDTSEYMGEFGSYYEPMLRFRYGVTYTNDGKIDKILRYESNNQFADGDTYMVAIYEGDTLVRLESYRKHYENWVCEFVFYLDGGRIVKVIEDTQRAQTEHELSYDAYGNLTAFTSIKCTGEAIPYNLQYEYNENGEFSAITRSVAGVDTNVSYIYDESGALKETQLAGEKSGRAEFTVDTNKNPLSIKIYETVNGKEALVLCFENRFNEDGSICFFSQTTYSAVNPDWWNKWEITVERYDNGRIAKTELCNYRTLNPESSHKKTVTTYDYDSDGNETYNKIEEYVNSNGKYVISNERITVLEFGKYGQIYRETTETTFNGDGSLKSSRRFSTRDEYNQEGRIIRTENINYSYNKYTREYYKHSYLLEEWHDNGEKKSIVNYIGGKHKKEEYYDLNKLGKAYRSKSVKYYSTGEKLVTEYNEEGERISEFMYSADNNFIRSWENIYEYSENGKKIGLKLIVDGKLSAIFEFEYTQDGRMYDKKVYSFYDDGYSIREYDENQNVIIEIKYDAFGNVISGEN